jgi:hypothetical protein
VVDVVVVVVVLEVGENRVPKVRRFAEIRDIFCSRLSFVVGMSKPGPRGGMACGRGGERGLTWP